ncbi:CDP-alcohol phosphatidyltransferase family protein [Methanooceanicella nereidis]|nr:CDP-alcohol phosphatidyltransferase family protein [Methanocella sp. CWC-04]
MVTDPFVNVFNDHKVSPNTLSLLSLVFALFAGISYYFSVTNIVILLAALVFVLLNSFLDGIDGALARRMGCASKYGDFLDHVIDRYADVFIISGIFFGGYVSEGIGAIVIIGVLLASYLGTQAQAVGIGRVYGGLMGRADRMVIIMLATCIQIAYPLQIGAGGISYSALGWALIVIGIASHFTAIQRIWYTGRSLNESPKNK